MITSHLVADKRENERFIVELIQENFQIPSADFSKTDNILCLAGGVGVFLALLFLMTR